MQYPTPSEFRKVADVAYEAEQRAAFVAVVTMCAEVRKRYPLATVIRLDESEQGDWKSIVSIDDASGEPVMDDDELYVDQDDWDTTTALYGHVDRVYRAIPNCDWDTLHIDSVLQAWHERKPGYRLSVNGAPVAEIHLMPDADEDPVKIWLDQPDGQARFLADLWPSDGRLLIGNWPNGEEWEVFADLPVLPRTTTDAIHDVNGTT